MSIKLCIVLRIILCKKQQQQSSLNVAIIRDCSGIWKKCVCAQVRGCDYFFVKWHDENKALGAKLSWWCVIIAEWVDGSYLFFWSVLKRHVCMCEYKHKAWHQTPDQLTDKSRGHWASGTAAPLLQDSTSAVYKKARTVGLSPIVPAEGNDLFISYVHMQLIKTILESQLWGCYVNLVDI